MCVCVCVCVCVVMFLCSAHGNSGFWHLDCRSFCFKSRLSLSVIFFRSVSVSAPEPPSVSVSSSFLPSLSPLVSEESVFSRITANYGSVVPNESKDQETFMTRHNNDDSSVCFLPPDYSALLVVLFGAHFDVLFLFLSASLCSSSSSLCCHVSYWNI